MVLAATKTMRRSKNPDGINHVRLLPDIFTATTEFGTHPNKRKISGDPTHFYYFILHRVGQHLVMSTVT